MGHIFFGLLKKDLLEQADESSKNTGKVFFDE
jgi:hypothetical protein